MAALVLVTGTGTDVGKTHTASALLRVLGRHLRAVGYKPAESGVTGAEGDDARRLREASSYAPPIAPFAYRFLRGVSPHLAARDEGVAIETTPLLRAVESLRAEADVVLVELPGGLFSPLSETCLNAELARALAPDLTLLVCVDRLGVLHDVGSTVRAADTLGVRIDGLLLNAPSQPDASTGSNAAELRLATRAPVLAVVPRAPSEAIAESGVLDRAAALVIGRDSSA